MNVYQFVQEFQAQLLPEVKARHLVLDPTKDKIDIHYVNLTPAQYDRDIGLGAERENNRVWLRISGFMEWQWLTCRNLELACVRRFHGTPPLPTVHAAPTYLAKMAASYLNAIVTNHEPRLLDINYDLGCNCARAEGANK